MQQSFEDERDGLPYIYYRPTDEEFLPNVINFCQLSPNDIFMDLGCGDGRILISAAENIGCRCIGIESDEQMVVKAIENIAAEGLENLIEIRHINIFTADLSEATVYFAYLFKWMNKLIPLLNRYPNKRIITQCFHFQDKMQEGIDWRSMEKSFKEANRSLDSGYYCQRGRWREYATPIEIS